MHDLIRIDIFDDSARISFLQDDMKLDLDTVTVLDEQIRRLYNNGIFNVELDFKKVGFITSLMLGKLVRYHRDLSDKNGAISIVNARESVFDVFEITEINRLIFVSHI